MTESTPYRPCVGCGFCCKRSPCPFGEADEEGAYRFLVAWENDILDADRYRCGRYDEIVDQPTADLAPAFGAGCCMSLCNEDRQEILVRLRKEAS